MNYNFKLYLFNTAYKLSLGNIICLFIIFLLICLNIFLLYTEYNKPNENNNDTLKSGFISNDVLINLSTLIIGSKETYSRYKKTKNPELLNEITISLDNVKVKISFNSNIIKKEISNPTGDLSTTVAAKKAVVTQADILESNIENGQHFLIKVYEKAVTLDHLKASKFYAAPTVDMVDLEMKIAEATVNLVEQMEVVDRCLNTAENHLSELTRLNEGFATQIIETPTPDITGTQAFLDSLSDASILAFTFLVFNRIFFGALISIIFVFYGEYLIHRFNLKNNYPVLYRLISLRVKSQTYILNKSLSLILIVLLLETLFCIYKIVPFG